MLELEVIANRAHKDSMFREYFSEKEKLLNLYNAINDTNYGDVDQVKLTTLQQVIWMGRKNDISFLLVDRLIIFIEHQSTINENMPIRALGFAGRMYEILIPDDELYGTKQTPIPTPEFYVFYNGNEPYPKEKILRLSDAFTNPVIGEQPLETIVKVININYDVNSKILERSDDLKNYSYFVYLVRKLIVEGKNLRDAIESATLVCLEKDILTEFLKEHGSEVINMLNWDIEKYKKAMRKEAREEAREEALEEGREEGREEGAFENAKKFAQKMLDRGDSIENVAEFTELSVDLIEKLKKGKVSDGKS